MDNKRMIIYVESEDYNITRSGFSKRWTGRKGSEYGRDDNGENDDIIYALSISTVVKKSTLALVE